MISRGYAISADPFSLLRNQFPTLYPTFDRGVFIVGQGQECHKKNRPEAVRWDRIVGLFHLGVVCFAADLIVLL